MPRYSYECTKCAHVYEKVEGWDAKARQRCPKCRAVSQRILVAPAIVFKGSGFYATDNRKSGYRGKDDGDGDGKSDSKGDADGGGDATGDGGSDAAARSDNDRSDNGRGDSRGDSKGDSGKKAAGKSSAKSTKK